ncbi:MAG: hypothetical protein ABWX94_02885 [Candidatus Saccharimonadales bacterium]
MSAENKHMSYIESIRPDINTRVSKVAQALAMLRQITNTHACIGNGDDRRVDLPHVYLDHPAQSDLVWFDLKDRRGNILDIDPENPDRKLELGDTDMYLAAGDYDGVRIATFTMDPPNILRYDGLPLTNPEIDAITHDLDSYQTAIENGHVSSQPGIPFSGSII